MLRSLYSGISGLRSHQQMLDVTGNNIANVNTVGFKASTTVFQDTLSQMTQGAGGPQTGIGGTNPAQIGLGVQVAGVSTNFAQGSAQATGKATDLMISGDGFFVTRLGNDTVYSRAGAFDFDANGRLVSSDGKIVQGYPATNGVVNDGRRALRHHAAARGRGARRPPPPRRPSRATCPPTPPSARRITRDATVYDAVRHQAHDVARVHSAPTTAGPSRRATARAPRRPPLTFGADGKHRPSGGTLAVGGITVDMTRAVRLRVAQHRVDRVAERPRGRRAAGLLDLEGRHRHRHVLERRVARARPHRPRDVRQPGRPREDRGVGLPRHRATRAGATVGGPGSAGIGSLAAGTLEMSNVDLSQEFTNLIVAQRGFQANARIITTSDEVLQELTNLKR